MYKCVGMACSEPCLSPIELIHRGNIKQVMSDDCKGSILEPGDK